MKLQGVKLIVGIGNPGKEYEKTYHNVGVLFIKYLMNKTPPISNFPARLRQETKSLAGGQFLISNTFMNQSGFFVVKALKKSGVKPAELLIIHDDSDIELGKYKFSFGRGSAGHKGIESIIKSLGVKNFWRLRIGIRPPEKISSIKHLRSRIPKEKKFPTGQASPLRSRHVSRRKAGEFVLKKITKGDLEILNKIFEKIQITLSS